MGWGLPREQVMRPDQPWGWLWCGAQAGPGPPTLKSGIRAARTSLQGPDAASTPQADQGEAAFLGSARTLTTATPPPP